MKPNRKPKGKPKFYQQMAERHPDVVHAYEALGEACRAAGPLDARTAALVKLALSIGAGLEGASHSAVRKALDAGCTEAQLEHVAILGATTLGFPAMMRARAWVFDETRGASPRR